MAVRFAVTNSNKTEDYQLILNGQVVGNISSLSQEIFEVDPGVYEVLFAESDQADIPTSCKPIRVTIEDGRELRLRVLTNFFTIEILDEEGTILNGKHGFLCGHMGEGVYVENTIC
jgi:hypothetical protein